MYASPLTTILTSWRLDLTVVFPTYPHKLQFFLHSFTFKQNYHSLIFDLQWLFGLRLDERGKQYVCIMIIYNMCVCYAIIMARFVKFSIYYLLYLLIIYVVIPRGCVVQTSTGFGGKKTIQKKSSRTDECTFDKKLNRKTRCLLTSPAYLLLTILFFLLKKINEITFF